MRRLTLPEEELFGPVKLLVSNAGWPSDPVSRHWHDAFRSALWFGDSMPPSPMTVIAGDADDPTVTAYPQACPALTMFEPRSQKSVQVDILRASVTVQDMTMWWLWHKTPWERKEITHEVTMYWGNQLKIAVMEAYHEATMRWSDWEERWMAQPGCEHPPMRFPVPPAVKAKQVPVPVRGPAKKIGNTLIPEGSLLDQRYGGTHE